LREANEKLMALSVQKDGFLGQVSHELRTPMTSIRSFAEILRDTEGLDAAQLKKYATIILEESIRLTRLLDEILDLSVLENQRVVLNRETGRISDLIDRAISATASFDGAKKLKIHRDPGAEDVTITTDLGRLSQVLINLVSNALKYCDVAQPELWVKVECNGDLVVLSFTDNGREIPEHQRDIIFEKFSRLSDASAAGSAGLGLAISREIMRNLGGEIRYQAGGAGPCFRIELPRHPPVETAAR
jgi:signal transduction histidine kinase